MALDSRHPLYAEFLPDWTQMRDTHRGERCVKAAGVKYLPATSGMVADGMQTATDPGWLAYNAYRTRARYPDAVRDAVQGLLGVMHREGPVIELPPQLEHLLEKATLRNESLAMVLQRINEQQLITGRLGLLGDVIDGGDREGEFYIAMYYGEHITNWDEGNRTGTDMDKASLVVLDETAEERQPNFEWERIEKYRVLVLGEADPVEGEEAVNNGGVYRVGVFRESTDMDESVLIEPTVGGRKSEEIPFVFVNAADVVAEPDIPPLLGLSNLCIAIYRGEADYRQSLFMQGQDTLVVIGMGDDEAPIRVGAGAVIRIPQASGDAKFIGVDSAGLSEQRSSLENDYGRAQQASGQLLDQRSAAKESGEALKIRVAVRTATLNQIAVAGAFGLQTLLRKLARWIGADPEKVIVTPNLDFVDDEMTGEQLGKYMAAKSLGAPLSLETVHRLMAERGVTDLTFEEEMALIEEEAAKAAEMQPGSLNPDGPDDDDDEDDDEADEEGVDTDEDDEDDEDEDEDE